MSLPLTTSGSRTTSTGLRLKVPMLRAQTFETAIIERYRRRESAVEERYRSSVGQTISHKITRALYESLSIPEINDVRLSFHVYPEDWDEQGPSSAILQPVLAQELKRSKVYLGVKRLMDIVGSSVALIVGLPFLLAIALAVKLTSKGPVLFRQVRLGQYGRKFAFLKFRSMYVDNDHTYTKHSSANSSPEHPAVKIHPATGGFTS
jgi:hypothetical protein